MMLLHMLPFIVILPATIYSLFSLISAKSFFSAETPSPPHSGEPPVTIIKPLKGVDDGSYENFASFCRQNYSGHIQIIFAVASADDPVIPIVRELISDFPEIGTELVINPAIHGANYKVSNLINAFPKARHEIIIITDSDIRVPPDYLRSVASHFSDKMTGLVMSPYRTSDVCNIAEAVEATGFTTEMIPNVMVALATEGLTFALGASMAVRREALASIGGFSALSDYLADDYHLGNKIASAGWEIALDRCFVESVIKEETLPAVLSRQLRWGRTIRASRPGGYLAFGVTLPFPAAMIALIASTSPYASLLSVSLMYAIRLSVSTLFSRSYVKDYLLPKWLWLIPLRDMLSFFVWALSFIGNRIEWRGRSFMLKPGGKIEETI